MNKTLLVSLASAALLFAANSALADHAPATVAPNKPYFSTQHPAAAIKAVGLVPNLPKGYYATDIVVLNFSSYTHEIQVDHPPILDDFVSPSGFDRITSGWYGRTDLHIYRYGVKIFDNLVGNHSIVAIYADGVDVEDNTL